MNIKQTLGVADSRQQTAGNRRHRPSRPSSVLQRSMARPAQMLSVQDTIRYWYSSFEEETIADDRPVSIPAAILDTGYWILDTGY